MLLLEWVRNVRGCDVASAMIFQVNQLNFQITFADTRQICCLSSKTPTFHIRPCNTQYTAHFIKTVDDIHEALVSTVPDIKFGLGFCEASGPRLVRYTGTDPELVELAESNTISIGCGHSFVLFLGEPTYPIHVLNTIKLVPEVCRIFCATANQVEVIVAETSLGRGIMGVIDGETPMGVETDEDIQKRRDMLKDFGYKL